MLNSELEKAVLETIREMSVKGKKNLNEVLRTQSSDVVTVNKMPLARTEVVKLRNKLVKAHEATSVSDMKKILNPRTIPLELVIIDKLWKDLYDMISELYKG